MAWWDLSGSIWMVLWIVLISSVGCVEGAQWNKLKKCSDSGFCRRQRAVGIGEGDVVVVEGWSQMEDGVTGLLRVESKWPSSSVENDEEDLDSRIQFWLTRRVGGTFRLVVDEKDAGGRFPRYRVGDVLVDLPDERLKLEQKGDLIVENDRVALKNDGGDAWAAVSFNPFVVRIHRQHNLSDIPLMEMNAQGMFLFERQLPNPGSHAQAHDHGKTSDDDDDEDDGDDGYDEEDKDHSDNDDPKEKDGVDGSETSGEVNDPSDESLKPDEQASPESSPESETLSDAANSTTPPARKCDGCWTESFSGASDSKVRGPESVGVDITFPEAVQLFGIPERAMSLSLPETIKYEGSNVVHVSEPYRLYNLDVFEYELEKTLGLYGSVPFLLARSSRLSGVLWLNAAETYVDIANLSVRHPVSHWFSESGVLDVLFLPGKDHMSAVFDQYVTLTGLQAMPPRFSLGYHQCRWNYRDDRDTRQVDGEFDTQNFPYDVIWLDIEHTDGKKYFTWDKEKFPDPSKLQQDIGGRGRKVVTIVDPHIKRDNGFQLHTYWRDAGYYVKKEDGKSDFDGWCWPGSSSYLDFTNSAARASWASKFNSIDYPHFTEHLHIWNDMNEPSVFNGPEHTMPKDLKHHGGWEHRDVHNVYGMHVHQATYEGLLRARENRMRPFVLSRALFAGSQRFGAVWTGDNTAHWSHLRASIPMILSLQLTGIMFSGADVGGFFGNPDTELLIRWYQVGVFQPFFRAHAHLDTARREPWLFGTENTELIRRAVRARYEFLPLWYTLFAANSIGLVREKMGKPGPPMRPLWWHFSDDTSAIIEDEWMVGDSLLIAPVLTEKAVSRSVYLPPGTENWYDLYGPHPGQPVSGNLSVAVSMSRMLVYARGGSIVTKQERPRRSSHAMETDPMTLIIAVEPERSSHGYLYWDDGYTFDFREGAFVLRGYSFDPLEGILSSSILAGDTTGNQFTSDVPIERVVFLGMKTAISNVTVRSKGDEGFPEYFAGSNILTIKKPGISATLGDWSIELNRW